MKLGYLAVLLCTATSLHARSATVTNKMNKLFHHTGAMSDKVVAYFDQKPVCNHLPGRPDATPEGPMKTLELFIPATKISSQECKSMVHQLKEDAQGAYRIWFDEVTKPIEGIKIHISYDADKVGVTYETFYAISAQHGVVFQFHHKELLNKLQDKEFSLRTLAHNERRPGVVLDCGHGGHDAGRVGFGSKEKDIALNVGLQVAELLKKKDISVWLTRSDDTFVALGERTSFANSVAQADLFVSIHANGAANLQAQGIETFYMPHPACTSAFSLLLADEQQCATAFSKTRAHQSALAADLVQSRILAAAQSMYQDVVNRKVKRAVSQVLLGVEMPAVLIEMGFLSHEREALLLADEQYQSVLASGICDAISSYFGVSS